MYRARDTKLKREVAIKVLPDEFSRDSERVSRFQREAEVLASLNHPNVAAIYDLKEAQGSRFLVLELVEGETLAERIARGPIPLDEALEIAKHICEGLEAAHEKAHSPGSKAFKREDHAGRHGEGAGRVPVERIRSIRNLCPAVSRTGRKVSDFDQRWRKRAGKRTAKRSSTYHWTAG